MHNYLREWKNQAKEQSRQETKMQDEFARARQETLQKNEEFISGLYSEGQETVDFRFDAFQLWGKGIEAEGVFQFLRENNLSTDDWLRSVFPLDKGQAIALSRLVEDWNADWEGPISLNYDVDHSCYQNAYRISLSPASGTEHTISVGRYFTTSWQWS